jgi:FAD:protein FMN transferase
MKIKPSLSRRGFLKIVVASGVAGLTIKYGIQSMVDGDIASGTRILMGIVVNIKAIGYGSALGHQAIQACFDRMVELENVLSRFKPGSQVSQLNRDGVLSNVHPALTGLIQQSHGLSQLTNGAFDITVKPLLDLYQAAPGILPTDQQINNALSLVDYREINWDSRTVSFRKPGMSITLDGIAKGYIVDEGVAVLKQYGFTNVMVEAGGDLIGLGEKSTNSPWKVGLQAPRARMGSITAAFTIQNQAIATSGDYMQAFTPDFANHHIIDPRLGHSPAELASASVFAPTVALADGLATGVMVMGQAGLHLVESLPACEAYLVTKDLTILKTPGLQI